MAMFSAPELTLRFIKQRPASAARVLAELPAQDSAAFLGAIPTRFASNAVRLMNAWPASQIVSILEPVAATALLRDLEFSTAARILRLMPRATRQVLLAALPRRLRRSFELSLSFPSRSIGAWMTTDIGTLAATETVADAQELVRRSPRHSLELLFVTDAQHRYLGVLHAVDLLRQAGQVSIADLVDADCPAVSAQARVDQVGRLSAWNDFSVLPVVSRSQELIGALPRRALGSGGALAASEVASDSLPGSVLGALAVSCTGLITLLAGAPQVHNGRDGEHDR